MNYTRYKITTLKELAQKPLELIQNFTINADFYTLIFFLDSQNTPFCNYNGAVIKLNEGLMSNLNAELTDFIGLVDGVIYMFKAGDG
jgi:hypothetical protein